MYCKVLNFVPRHEAIVAEILGTSFSRTIIVFIGLAGLVMAVWVLSNYRSRLNAITQIAIVGAMNILEFVLVPELLLWGRINALFAFLFIGLIYYNEFVLGKK